MLNFLKVKVNVVPKPGAKNIGDPRPPPKATKYHRNALPPVLVDEIANQIIPIEAFVFKIMQPNAFKQVYGINNTGTERAWGVWDPCEGESSKVSQK
jgi:hypothetical protein